jgi:hypothetical protein
MVPSSENCVARCLSVRSARPSVSNGGSADERRLRGRRSCAYDRVIVRGSLVRYDRSTSHDISGGTSLLTCRALLLALALGPIMTACHSSFHPYYDTEDRTLTIFGGTCGERETTTSASARPTRVSASCGAGLVCQGGSWGFFEPADLTGRWVHTCLPPGSVARDAVGQF